MDFAFSEEGVSGLDEGTSGRGKGSIDSIEDAATGVGCGTIPPTIQSN